jgi:hypothetical protein
MELNRKTIQINPELFKISGGNTTRKKQKKPNDIRIKTNVEKPKKMSTIKRNILKMIRNHHQERRKKERRSNTDFVEEPLHKISSVTDKFQNEFDESLEYLSKLTKEVDDKKQSYTIKRYPSTLSSSSSSPSFSLPEPTYGCLKNGKLPTYRTWLNQTRKNIQPPQMQMSQMQMPQMQMQPQPQIIIQNSNPNHLNPYINSNLNIQNPNLKPNNSIVSPSPSEISLNENLKKFSKIQQFERKNQNPNLNLKKWKYPKQKKTIRRTYYVGRSRVHPRISVLVSNKTIRARTTLKQQELKQVPIAEVKKYLLKHGFIKVGTSSPNDVLREMYENAQLICGEIKNHNPENLLYNYFNAPSEL